MYAVYSSIMSASGDLHAWEVATFDNKSDADNYKEYAEKYEIEKAANKGKEIEIDFEVREYSPPPHNPKPHISKPSEISKLLQEALNCYRNFSDEEWGHWDPEERHFFLIKYSNQVFEVSVEEVDNGAWDDDLATILGDF